MKKTLVAAVALAALCASGAAKWKNLNDKAHISGDKLTEADLLGKAVFVYYWDCAETTSVKLLPEVEKVWKAFQTKKFQVVGNYVGAKEDEKVKAAIQKNKVTFPVYYNFSLDPDPKVGFQKAPFFNVVNHRGVSVLGKASVKEATEAAVEAVGSIGMPISLCGDVDFKKFKGMAGQLKLGKNVSNIVKALEKKKADKDPNVVSEAQEILSAIERAMDDEVRHRALQRGRSRGGDEAHPALHEDVAKGRGRRGLQGVHARTEEEGGRNGEGGEGQGQVQGQRQGQGI